MSGDGKEAKRQWGRGAWGRACCVALYRSSVSRWDRQTKVVESWAAHECLAVTSIGGGFGVTLDDQDWASFYGC